MSLEKPTLKPNNPCFSSGPCSKRPGYSLDALADAPFGRSHRSALGKAKLAEAIERSRDILGLPDDYRIGIVPASDTGAVEMVLWSMLGARGVDMLAWESFGKGWITDVTQQLNLSDVRRLEAPYGQLPDLDAVDWTRDVVFTWNGTTSGVKVPHADWIADDREGLSIVDGTSAAFAMDIPWQKVDVFTYSWQKVMGGEGAHGMLILSPRAVERLESYTPPWPLPKIFRMTKNGKLIEGIFEGSTINTPSMLCVEDAIDGLKWAESLGGLPALLARTNANLAAIERWVDQNEAIDFLAESKETRSNTSVCLKITADWFVALSDDDQAKTAKEIVKRLADEGVAFDIGSYKEAPTGLRLWAGATVETSDLEALLPWIDWALQKVKPQ